MKRRKFLLVLAAAPLGIARASRADDTEIMVYKGPT